jgi:hypothetical protein
VVSHRQLGATIHLVRDGATRTRSTERLDVSHGTDVAWTIEADVTRSSVLVRD